MKKLATVFVASAGVLGSAEFFSLNRLQTVALAFALGLSILAARTIAQAIAQALQSIRDRRVRREEVVELETELVEAYEEVVELETELVEAYEIIADLGSQAVSTTYAVDAGLS